MGCIPEGGFSENSEFVNPEMRETLGFLFQKERLLKLGVSYHGYLLKKRVYLNDYFAQIKKSDHRN